MRRCTKKRAEVELLHPSLGVTPREEVELLQPLLGVAPRDGRSLSFSSRYAALHQKAGGG